MTPAPATAQVEPAERPGQAQPTAATPAARRLRARAPPTFHERPQPDPRDRAQPALRPERQALLRARIKDLRLQLAGTHLERLIHQLHEELGARGIDMRPQCYLSDEWGCPSGIPVIGIPFYLANPALQSIEGELGGGRGVGARDPHVPPPRGGALLQLRLPPLRDPGLEDALRRLPPAVQGRLQAQALQPGLRDPHPGLVRAEAPGRGLRRDLRGVAHPGAGLAPAVPELGRGPEEAPVRGRHGAPSWATGRRRSPSTPTTSTPTRWRRRSPTTTGSATWPSGSISRSARSSTPSCSSSSSRPASAPASAAQMLRDQRQTLIQAATQYSGVNRAVVRSVVDHLTDRTDQLKLTAAPDRASGYVAHLGSLRHRAGDERALHRPTLRHRVAESRQPA